MDDETTTLRGMSGAPVGRQIRLLRVMRGLSLSQVSAGILDAGLRDENGKPLTLSSAALSRIEASTRMPALGTMLGLAHTLRCEFIIAPSGCEVVPLD